MRKSSLIVLVALCLIIGAGLTGLDLVSGATRPGVGEAACKVYTQWPFDAAEAKRRQEETARALGLPVEETIDLGRGVKMTFILIPAGEFMMGDTLTPEEVDRRWPGADINWHRSAHPRHLVRVSKPFYLGKTEVTRGQFAEFVRDAAYRTDIETRGGATPPGGPLDSSRPTSIPSCS